MTQDIHELMEMEETPISKPNFNEISHEANMKPAENTNDTAKQPNHSTNTEPTSDTDAKRTSELEEGEAVWAKIGSYPWWPAKIENEQDLPSFVIKIKPKQPHYAVYFFGTKEFGWVSRKNLKRLNEEDFTKKSKSKQFLLAVKEVNDQSLWPAKGYFKNSVDPSQPPAEEEEVEFVPTKEEKVVKKVQQKKKRKVEQISLRDQIFRLRIHLQEFLQSEV